MTGFEALQALKEGKKVKRIPWHPECYIEAYHTEKAGWLIEPTVKFFEMFYTEIPEHRCVIDNMLTCCAALALSDDWEIVE